MTEVLFPRLKESDPDAEGVLATWFVQDGDAVAEGDLLCEVQVDKTSADVASSSTGTVRFKVAESEVVRQGAVLATVE